MKILLIYFSGSGSTKAIAEILKSFLTALGFDVTVVDLNIATKASIVDDFDYIVFGTPVYHCYPPDTVMEFIHKIQLQLKYKRVFLFATYGLYSGNTLRMIAKKLQAKNIHCVGHIGLRGPGSDASMMAPDWFKFVFYYEKATRRKLEFAANKISETFHCQNPKTRIPFFKWYALLDYIPNRLIGRSIYQSIYRHYLELLLDRWDGSPIECPRYCWVMQGGNPTFHPRNCEFCMRCVHRTPGKAIVFSSSMKDKPRLDQNFYTEKKKEILGDDFSKF